MKSLNMIKTLEKEVTDSLKQGQAVVEHYNNEVENLRSQGKSPTWETDNIRTLTALAGGKLSTIAGESGKHLDTLIRQENLWKDRGLLLRNMALTPANANGEPENPHLESITRMRLIEEGKLMSSGELKSSCDDALADGNLGKAALYQRINNARGDKDNMIDLSHVPIPGQADALQAIANAKSAQGLLVVHYREVTTGKTDSVARLAAGHEARV
jgi:hypothetical protein